MKQSIKTLEEHNAWRRGAESEQLHPAQVGVAIDDCIKAAKRYEMVRTFNVHEFQVLFMRSLKGENFDDMVDEVIEARAR